MQELDSRALRQAVSAAQATLDKVAALAGIGSAGARYTTRLSVAKRLEAERRNRDACFPEGVFGEPVWDVLLALYIAGIEEHRLSVGEVYRIAGVAEVAGRRLLDRLEAKVLIARRLLPSPGKTRLVELTREAEDRMSDYLMRLL